MAITYPRTIPAILRAASCSLAWDRVQAMSRTRGGVVRVSERGRTLASLTITTPPMRRVNYAALQAWVDSLRGSLNTFYGYDLLRCRPGFYPGSGWAGVVRAAGGAFDGTITVSSAAGYIVNVAGLPAGWVFSEGDYISWPWGSTRTLHRVVLGGTTTGGVGSIQVEPDVPPSGIYPATAKLERADAVFMLSGTVDFTTGVHGRADHSARDPISGLTMAKSFTAATHTLLAGASLVERTLLIVRLPEGNFGFWDDVFVASFPGHLPGRHLHRRRLTDLDR